MRVRVAVMRVRVRARRGYIVVTWLCERSVVGFGMMWVWMDEWVDEWMDGWMSGWMSGWMDGWIRRGREGRREGREGRMESERGSGRRERVNREKFRFLSFWNFGRSLALDTDGQWSWMHLSR